MLILAGPVVSERHLGDHHPERPARINAVMAGIEDLALGGELLVAPEALAGTQELERVHLPGHLAHLEAFSALGGGQLDPDTYATPDSWTAARRSAGAGLSALRLLRERGTGVAFVAARPPGHHALADRAMGFCLLNNVAVAASWLTAQGERVLVVDWDVHHGNGSQAIFWDDPGVLYVSTHQAPLYPGTGRVEETGGPAAPGLTVNVPLPPGATGDVVRRALGELAMPVIEAFDPTWVLVSAGFDAHRDDPLADLALSSGDFARLARDVAGVVPRPGRLALFLEGGYDLRALQRSVTDTLAALLGETGLTEEATSGGPGAEHVAHAAAVRARLLGPPGAVPDAQGRGGPPAR